MGERRRVAVLTTAHPALDGRIFHKEVNSLVGAGFDVVFVAPDAEGAREAVEASGARFHGLRPGTKRSTRPRRWFEVSSFLWRHRTDIDVWHFHDPELLVVCVALRPLISPRVQLVYDVHENYAAAVMQRDWIPAPTRRFVAAVSRFVERHLANRCRLVVAATPDIGANFPVRHRRAVITVRNYPFARGNVTALAVGGVSLIPARTPGTTRCVYAGGLTPVRGIREIVDAMRMLDGEPIELLLAGTFGSSDFEAEIRADAPPSVRVLGNLPWEQVPALLATSDVGLCCLLPAPNYIDSLPTKLFEYLEAGLAVVASDFPSWDPIVSEVDVGLQVDPRDPAAIASAIRTLAVDDVRRTSMGERGRRMTQASYTWEREAGVLFAAYEWLTTDVTSDAP